MLFKTYSLGREVGLFAWGHEKYYIRIGRSHDSHFSSTGHITGGASDKLDDRNSYPSGILDKRCFHWHWCSYQLSSFLLVTMFLLDNSVLTRYSVANFRFSEAG